MTVDDFIFRTSELKRKINLCFEELSDFRKQYINEHKPCNYGDTIKLTWYDNNNMPHTYFGVCYDFYISDLGEIRPCLRCRENFNPYYPKSARFEVNIIAHAKNVHCVCYHNVNGLCLKYFPPGVNCQNIDL